jgi:hypothetical protein
MLTFQDRLKDLVGTRGYENTMRRSLQSIILYEAKRCISPRLSSLRPFQRKVAFLDQACALVESLDFLFPHQKDEILWRTATSKEQLAPDFAWKRMKLIEKEMISLSQQVKPFVNTGRSHDESVDLLVQHLYVSRLLVGEGNKSLHTIRIISRFFLLFQEALTCVKGKAHPFHWEHAHNHVIMAFRLYYIGDQFDPNFPTAVPPREIVVPAEKPKPNQAPYYLQMNIKKAPIESRTTQNVDDINSVIEPTIDVGDLIMGDANNPVEDRRKVLREVREHLDILKEFEGVISNEDLAKRKRELFLALPSAPPAASPTKKSRV